MRDHNSLTETMVGGFRCLFQDFSALTGHSFDADFSRIGSFHDYREILSYLSKHEAILTSFLKTGTISPRNVKVADGLPVFLRVLWSALREGDDGTKVQSVFLLRQCFALWKKAEVAVDPGPDFQKFVARQNEPRLLSIPWLGLVDAMASYWGKYQNGFKSRDLKADDLFPYTSSGATYEKTPVLDRVEAVEDLVSLRHPAYLPYVPKVVSVPENRAVDVPKDWTKVRVVFVEPSPRMQAQQCLRRWLELRVECGDLSRRVDFSDQGFQRKSLSLPGRSSIDLSDASDYVRSALVWRFFRDTPVLRSALFGSRSRMCNVEGASVPLHSYSTMGNATTFTVMTVILACLLEVCESDFRRKTGHRCRKGTVFGDDIVCDDAIAGTVLEYLKLLGLKPNERKTFIASAFRESCGLDLFQGTDVTPTAVKRWKSDSDDDIVARVAYSNALWRKGLWRTANYLSDREDVPVNTSSSDDCYYSFCQGVDKRWSRWLADEQRHVWDFRAPPVPSYESDSFCHFQYALVNGRLRANEAGHSNAE